MATHPACAEATAQAMEQFAGELVRSSPLQDSGAPPMLCILQGTQVCRQRAPCSMYALLTLLMAASLMTASCSASTQPHAVLQCADPRAAQFFVHS